MMARQGWQQTESGPDGRPDAPWPSTAATRRLGQGGARAGVGEAQGAHAHTTQPGVSKGHSGSQ